MIAQAIAVVDPQFTEQVLAVLAVFGMLIALAVLPEALWRFFDFLDNRAKSRRRASLSGSDGEGKQS